MIVCEVTKPYAYKKLRAYLEAMEPDIVGQRLDKYKLVSLIDNALDILRVEVDFENTSRVPKDEINMNAGYSQGIDKWKDPDIYPTTLTLLFNNKQRTYSFSKEGFDKAEFESQDKQGNKGPLLKVTKPMDTLFEGVDTDV